MSERSFDLDGVVLPLSAAALRRIGASYPILPSVAELRRDLTEVLAEFPAGFSLAAFDRLAVARQRVVMTRVHLAALAGIDRFPDHASEGNCVDTERQGRQ